jgi:hypothetical protein
MRTSITLIIATTLGSTLLTFAGGFSPAAARITLGQCISNNEACRAACFDKAAAIPPEHSSGYCWSQCWDNHAACVDAAMSAIDSGPSKKPPKGNIPRPPSGGILDPGTGPSPQGPAPTGGRRRD